LSDHRHRVRGVSTGSGSSDYATVTIERIERSDSGTLTGLGATVEQRCEASVGPAFRARVHYSA
jgi:hypothetical protein